MKLYILNILLLLQRKTYKIDQNIWKVLNQNIFLDMHSGLAGYLHFLYTEFQNILFY